MDWARFLRVVRCAGPSTKGQTCQGELQLVDSGLKCRACASTYNLHPELGFPQFAPQSEEERKADKYEDPGQRFAERYLALIAFGYLFVRRGESEGFYRVINELGFSTPLNKEGEHLILEVGCGVGRNVADYARHFPNALVVGVDYSERMREHAYRVILGDPLGGPVEISMEREGFGLLSADSMDLENAFLVQANAMLLPFTPATFDIVLAPNIIDRVPDPERLISEITRVLKPGGYFVFADPFNWVKRPDWWGKCRTLEQLCALFAHHSLNVDIAFDKLPYRELKDARGAYDEFPEAVVRAIRA